MQRAVCHHICQIFIDKQDYLDCTMAFTQRDPGSGNEIPLNRR